jgi:cytochrome c oxidase subunit II
VRRAPVRMMAVLAVLPLAMAGCLPAPATSEAREVAQLYGTFVLIAAMVAIVVLGLAIFAILRYRAGPGEDELPPQVHGNLKLEAIWTGIPLLTIVGLLALTVVVLGSFDAAVRANATVDVRVTAFRWGWRFTYPNDGVVVEGIGTAGPEVYVPVGENVHVSLTGEDVIHSFYVPRFLFKKDAVPGRENAFAFTVDEAGRYGGQCAEFCGIYHSKMPFTVVAVPRSEYDAWVASHRGIESPAP